MSVATVSRVLNNEDIVSETTKIKVLEAVKELDYHPNLAGRNLRKNETKVVLIIISSIINSLFPKIIKGIEERADEMGYNVLVCTTDNKQEKIKKSLDLLNRRIADGAILLSVELDEENKSIVKSMSENIPIVSCCEYQEDLYLPTVSIDDYKAMYEATEYLIKQGRRRILHISCDNTYTSTLKRLNGYKDALADNGIPYDENLVIKGNYGYRSTLDLMETFLFKNIPIDGITALNDRMAAAAVNVLMSKGVNVPEDVYVIGFDNSTVCYMLNPTLSSVAQPRTELGRKAFDAVYKLLKKETCEDKTVLNYEIKHKESTNYNK